MVKVILLMVCPCMTWWRRRFWVVLWMKRASITAKWRMIWTLIMRERTKPCKRKGHKFWTSSCQMKEVQARRRFHRCLPMAAAHQQKAQLATGAVRLPEVPEEVPLLLLVARVGGEQALVQILLRVRRLEPLVPRAVLGAQEVRLDVRRLGARTRHWGWALGLICV